MPAKAPLGLYPCRLHQRVPALLLVLAVALVVQQFPELPGDEHLEAIGLSAVSTPRVLIASPFALTRVVLAGVVWAIVLLLLLVMYRAGSAGT